MERLPRLKKNELSKLTDEEKLERKRLQQRINYQINIDSNRERKKLQMREQRKKPDFVKIVTHKQTCKDNWRKKTKGYACVLDNFNDNYETLYRIYQSTKFCDDCAIELDTGKHNQRKCLDHCHKSGYFRGVVCHHCNCKRQ